MAIADDISVDTSGNIRWTGNHHDNSPTYYTVLELHRFLQDLADDEQASGNDLLDITDDTPSDRSTDNIITLLGTYNIDDIVAEHLYDGSVTQGSGTTQEQYSGIVIVGSINDQDTIIQVVQNDNVINEFWKTETLREADLKDATANILLRILVKTVTNGVPIDGKRVRVFARHLGDTYAEFNATLGLGNSTAALFTNSDINNANDDATIAALAGISDVDPGYNLIDLNNGNGSKPYYSEWDTNQPTNDINDLYEWAKWIQQTAVSETGVAETGTNYVIDNATLIGQAQSFDPGANNEALVRVDVELKAVASPTGPITCELRAHSGTFGTSSIPTGAALATSESIEAADLTTAYQNYTFHFWGAQQYELQSGTDYVLVFLHPNGDATNYVHIEGSATGSHEGNQSDLTATTWTPAAAEDLGMLVRTSPVIHGISGEKFRGITHEFEYDGKTLTINEDDTLVWGCSFDYGTEAGWPFTIGERVDFGTSGAIGRILHIQDNGATGFAVCDIFSGTPAGTETVTGADSGASMAITGNILNTTGPFGSGLLLADDGADTYWIQLLTGAAPINNQEVRAVEQDGHADVNVTINSRAVSPSFIGASTGSALIGAFGIGVQSSDLTQNDLLIALDTTTQTPPNNVTFTVSSIISGDRVLVAPRTGSVIDVGQYLLETTLSATNEVTVKLNDGTDTAIESDIPLSTAASGNVCYLRIELDSGIYRRVAYTSFANPTADEFDIASTDFSGANIATAGNNVYVAYIDVATSSTSESVTQVYAGDPARTLFVRVRDGGGTPIKTFESDTATLASTGGSVAAIRQTDA
jgi:hypothetical protein